MKPIYYQYFHHIETSKLNVQVKSIDWFLNNLSIGRKKVKVARVVSIKLFFMDWFYYDLIIPIK